MNNVNLLGTLTKDVEIRYSNDLAIARFSIAINRMPKKDGSDAGADFINIVAFGKRAEVIEKYFHKGSRIAITGHIQTGSYEKDGHKVYTTDVILDGFDFVDKKSEVTEHEGFEAISDEDCPF